MENKYRIICPYCGNYFWSYDEEWVMAMKTYPMTITCYYCNNKIKITDENCYLERDSSVYKSTNSSSLL